MSNLPLVLAFDDVALRVIGIAWWAFGILVAALFLAAMNNFFFTIGRADDVIFEAVLGLDAPAAVKFYELYREFKPKNVAVAWFLTVVLGPIGTFLYLEQWGKFAAAIVTLNGFGAWWIESWFSTPRLVLDQNRRIARTVLAQLSFALKQDEANER
jgi:uncharacterized protein YjeT (DUF2065 family)